MLPVATTTRPKPTTTVARAGRRGALSVRLRRNDERTPGRSSMTTAGSANQRAAVTVAAPNGITSRATVRRVGQRPAGRRRRPRRVIGASTTPDTISSGVASDEERDDEEGGEHRDGQAGDGPEPTPDGAHRACLATLGDVVQRHDHAAEPGQHEDAQHRDRGHHQQPDQLGQVAAGDGLPFADVDHPRHDVQPDPEREEQDRQQGERGEHRPDQRQRGASEQPYGPTEGGPSAGQRGAPRSLTRCPPMLVPSPCSSPCPPSVIIDHPQYLYSVQVSSHTVYSPAGDGLRRHPN